jgi:hypothetical protein
VGGTSRQLSQFKDGRVLWPSLSYDGKTMLFERDFRIWKMETKEGKASAIPIQLRGIPAGSPAARTTLNSFEELALSPDGRKLALVGRGEIFAVSARTGGPGVADHEFPGARVPGGVVARQPQAGVRVGPQRFRTTSTCTISSRRPRPG